MNFDQKIGAAAMKTSSEGSKQEGQPVAKQKLDVPRIISAGRDEDFPGSTIFKTQDAEGKIKGYAIRTKEDGSIEGNEIGFSPDGSEKTSIQKLNESNIEMLRDKGLLEKFESIKKAEQEKLEASKRAEMAKKMDDTKTWLQRLYLQGTNPYVVQQAEPNEKMYIDEAIKSLKVFSDTDQISLAEDFVKTNSSLEKLHYVMIKLNGTAFGKKLAELMK